MEWEKKRFLAKTLVKLLSAKFTSWTEIFENRL